MILTAPCTAWEQPKVQQSGGLADDRRQKGSSCRHCSVQNLRPLTPHAAGCHSRCAGKCFSVSTLTPLPLLRLLFAHLRHFVTSLCKVGQAVAGLQSLVFGTAEPVGAVWSVEPSESQAADGAPASSSGRAEAGGKPALSSAAFQVRPVALNRRLLPPN